MSLDAREPFEVRRLTPADLAPFQDGMPSWNSREYPKRLAYQARGLAVQLVAWVGVEPVGRAMIVFPGHPEWSFSAHREVCPEVRDLAVGASWQRRGIATALVGAAERDAADRGFGRLGMMVGLENGYGAARSLYDRLGYASAHGPFISSARLEAEDGGPLPVAGVCRYLVKDLNRGAPGQLS